MSASAAVVTGFPPVVPSARNADLSISIVVAEGHALFREALRELLEGEKDFEVVGEAGSGPSAVDLVRSLRPSVVLLDFHMPGSGLDALARLSTLEPPVHTLVLATDASDDEVVEALRLGARGVVMKGGPTELLFKSIRLVAAGQYWVGRECVGGLIEQIQRRHAPPASRERDPLFELTARELQLVAAVVDGCPNNDIAAALNISAKTVKHHLTRIFAKLGLSNRVELALYAVQHQFRERRFR